VDLGVVQGVTGWHISSVRQALAPRIAHRVPYVYTALYEGGERTEGVFLTSETPADQLRPAMRLLATSAGCAAGSSSATTTSGRAVPPGPRTTTRASRAAVCGRPICRSAPTTSTDVLRRIERSDADAVLMLLVGSDAVRFNRAFAAAGLDGGVCG
jgi:urea transport system substrate-binding protein